MKSGNEIRMLQNSWEGLTLLQNFLPSVFAKCRTDQARDDPCSIASISKACGVQTQSMIGFAGFRFRHDDSPG